MSSILHFQRHAEYLTKNAIKKTYREAKESCSGQKGDALKESISTIATRQFESVKKYVENQAKTLPPTILIFTFECSKEDFEKGKKEIFKLLSPPDINPLTSSGPELIKV